jgi:hypothetical protein
MKELPQPVGNAKICGEFDWDATMAVDPNPNDEGPFQRLVDLNPAAGREEARGVVALPATNDVIRRFNRDTEWLAMRVLGAVVFAVLVLAVLIQEHHPKAADLTQDARQSGGDLLLNADPATLSKFVGLYEKSSPGEITSRHGFTEILPQENPSPRMETAASTQTPVLGLTPKINHPDLHANASPWSSVHRQDSARVIRPKIHNVRYGSSVRLGFVDVKMRLIALWHQSLARSEKSRSRTAFSNSNRAKQKQVSYRRRSEIRTAMDGDWRTESWRFMNATTRSLIGASGS